MPSTVTFPSATFSAARRAKQRRAESDTSIYAVYTSVKLHTHTHTRKGIGASESGASESGALANYRYDEKGGTHKGAE
eukprot:3613979-Pyramimonas_sp.AAC.1